jgi:hypothetical protein
MMTSPSLARNIEIGTKLKNTTKKKVAGTTLTTGGEAKGSKLKNAKCKVRKDNDVNFG